MALAPDNVRFTWRTAAPLALVNPSIYPAGTGFFGLYGVLRWDEHETGNCFYRVETKLLGAASYVYLRDLPKGIGFVSSIELGRQLTDNTRARTIESVRVTCYLIPDDGSPGIATLDLPALPALAHVQATNLVITKVVSRNTGTGATGDYVLIGDKAAQIIAEWDDDSVWLASVRPVLTKTLSDGTEYSFPLTYSNPIVDRPGFLGSTLMHGLSKFDAFIAQPPQFGVPPSPESYLRDGDLLTLKIATDVLAADNPYPFLILTVKSFRFFRKLTINPFIATATRDQAFSQTATVVGEIGSSQNIPAWSATGLPAGLSINASTGLISGTPTVAGVFAPVITATNPNGIATSITGAITVNAPAIPVINGPATTQNLTTLTPVSLRLTATNDPSSFAIVSGTLPTGLSLNTSTGAITGTPTVPQSSANVAFKATNTVGDSANYTIAFAVTALVTPTINSGAAITVYPNEPVDYTITTTPPATTFTASGLPIGLSLNGAKIKGSIPEGVAAGTYQVLLTAINAAGPGTPFTLTITVEIRPPVISSTLAVNANLDANFVYQIIASHSPTSYGASNLPAGLTIDTATGKITGKPTAGGAVEVTITALNSAGVDQKTLVITVIVPGRPVIDASITQGRTITAKSGVPFSFQPAASNNPTGWAADPVPPSLKLDAAKGTLSGIVQLPGLYGVIFVASNAGGDSDPVTFYFLVEAGPPTALQLNTSGIDLWVDLHDGSVKVGEPKTGESKVTVKRGDTAQFVVRFHKDGNPIDLVPSTLKMGARVGFDDDYVIYTDSFSPIAEFVGTFTIYPDFSANNAELDNQLNQDKLELKAELQWETTNPSTRRSSQTFDLTVLRDIVHPD